MKEQNYFTNLNEINVNENTDKKGQFTYLSWAWAWAEVKKQYPNASYEIERFGEAKLPYIENELGYLVFTRVTINDITHEMWLPVMDFRNKAIQIGKATMMDINKAIMRCLVKNIGMHGLGLYLYAGEDLPEKPEAVKKQAEPKKAKENKEKPTIDEAKQLAKLLGDRVEKMLEFYKVEAITDMERQTVLDLIIREGGVISD